MAEDDYTIDDTPDIEEPPYEERVDKDWLIQMWTQQSDWHRKASARYNAMLNTHRMRLFDDRDEVMHVLDTKWAKMAEPQRRDALGSIKSAVRRQAQSIADEINAVLKMREVPYRISVDLRTHDYKPLFK
jgi:hypothetical protein